MEIADTRMYATSSDKVKSDQTYKFKRKGLYTVFQGVVCFK